MKCIKIKTSTEEHMEGIHLKIRDDFKTLFTASRIRDGMAMFSTKIPIDDKTIYLVPHDTAQMQIMLKAYNGEISELPRQESLSLLVGDLSGSFN